MLHNLNIGIDTHYNDNGATYFIYGVEELKIKILYINVNVVACPECVPEVSHVQILCRELVSGKSRRGRPKRRFKYQ